MHALVKTAFTRLYVLDPIEEEEKLSDNGTVGQEGEAKMTVSTELSGESESRVTEPEVQEVVAPQQIPTPSENSSKPSCTYLDVCYTAVLSFANPQMVYRPYWNCYVS